MTNNKNDSSDAISDRDRNPGEELSADSGPAPDIAENVHNKVADAGLTEAKKAFTREWRASVPGLPERIPLLLTGIRNPGIEYSMRFWRKHQRAPQLKLVGNFEDGVSVDISRGKSQPLGLIRVKDVLRLRQLSRRALSLYRPELLEIRRGEDGSVEFVAVELILIAPATEAEVSPIALHEAAEAIIHESAADEIDAALAELDLD